MYNRILLKLSGEALSGEGGMGFAKEQMAYLVEEVKTIFDKGISIGLVVGAGNIFRGAELAELEPKMADQIGMLGTNINAIYLKSFFENAGIPARVFSQVVQLQSTEKINYDRVNDSMRNCEIVIFGGGTSNPFFTTDTAAALRAVEMGAEIIIKATKVDGIFSADPRKVADAVKFDTLSYSDAIEKNLKIMDTEAFSICKRYGMKIQVINFFEKGNLLKVVMGEQVGTKVTE